MKIKKAHSAFLYYALSTNPDFKHLVHTYSFLLPVGVFIVTCFKLDLNILFDLLCEWLT